MSNESFNFNALIQESKECLLKPKEYFASMKLTGGLTEPIIKAVIYGAVAGIISFLWVILKIGAASGMGVFGGAAGIMVFIWAIIGAIIGLFIGAVILLVISAICKGNTDFEANARVTAALMVLMPVNALLGFFSGINLALGTIVASLVALYGVYMMFHGLTQALKANQGTSKVISYILAGIMIIFMITGLAAKRAGTRVLKKMEETGGLVDEYTKQMEKYQKELEKAAKEIEAKAEEVEEEVEEAVSDTNK